MLIFLCSKEKDFLSKLRRRKKMQLKVLTLATILTMMGCGIGAVKAAQEAPPKEGEQKKDKDKSKKGKKQVEPLSGEEVSALGTKHGGAHKELTTATVTVKKSKAEVAEAKKKLKPEIDKLKVKFKEEMKKLKDDQKEAMGKLKLAQTNEMRTLLGLEALDSLKKQKGKKAKEGKDEDADLNPKEKEGGVSKGKNKGKKEMAPGIKAKTKVFGEKTD